MTKNSFVAEVTFKDNIWGVNLADMQSINILKDFIFYCVIDIDSKYAWVVPLKDRKGITITNAFQKYLDDSGCKPSKILADKGIEFYNTSIKSWL